MFKLFRNKNDLIYWDKRTHVTFTTFDDLYGNTKTINISKDIPYGTEIKGKQKEEIEKKFIDFCLDQCKDWIIDGFPVIICRSAAGFYAGCIDPDEGPYIRISGYGDDKMIVAHWMLMNHPVR